MSLYERLLVPGSTELPECRCGEDMKVARTERLPDQTDAHIRIYNCSVCGHEMRLTVWADDLLA
jgi:hypothetical protein